MMKKQVWFVFKVSVPISINLTDKSTFIICITKVEAQKKPQQTTTKSLFFLLP